MKRASIIIDNYNYARFLREAIDSALSQDYADCEVVVVDDGSTDDSAEIISSYGDQIIPVLKENGGQASAFNAGFLASCGEVVCFLDADDVLAADAVSKTMPCFQEPDTAKAHWALWIIDELGVKQGTLFPPEEMPDGDFRDEAIHNGPFYDSNFLPPTSGNAWARWFLQKIMPIPEDDYDHGADVYLHTLAPIFGKLRSVKAPQGFYRAHRSNHYWDNVLTDKKLAEYQGRYESSCAALHKYLEAEGIKPDETDWKSRSFNYLWLARLRDARIDIERLVAEGGSFILVDNDDWGRGELVPKRYALSLTDANGDYLGQPPDDAAAIARLEELRKAECKIIAFWWTAFWWFDEYPGLSSYLNYHYSKCVETDGLIVFDLSKRVG